jgi:hypothetical protein
MLPMKVRKTLWCDKCDNYKVTVSVGFSNLCDKCLRRALAKLEKAQAKGAGLPQAKGEVSFIGGRQPF